MVAKRSSRKRTSKKPAARKPRRSKQPASRRRQTARGRGRTTGALVAPRKLASGLPSTVFAQASPRSLGGTSMFDMESGITSDNAMAFASEDGLIRGAAARLQAAGFEILALSQTTINIAGPPSLYEKVFETTLFPEEREVIKEEGVEDTATFVESADTAMPGYIDVTKGGFQDVLEGIAIEEPRYFHQNAFAPLKSYWHLRVPGDVSLGINADKAHRGGTTGRNVKCVMTDSGWFKHPYFVQRGYKASPVVLGPGTANAANDEVGHGTGESANMFAVAPDINFTMVKLSFVNTIGGFNAAVALGPAIISNSWGSHKPTALTAADQALAAAIALAVANGIVVVFSAGNGQWGFPGQHPDVISAGGTYMLPNGTFQASNYASGFASNIYPGRNSPDVTGLVGQLPKAAYIMLPLQSGDQIDVGNAGLTHPNGDETASNDGWAAFSGTSAAAPQIAGVCALIKQACPKLTPADIKGILKSTARDVTTGVSNTGTSAAVGPDLATGHGLVDAHKAVLVAKVKCLGPIIPIVPTPIQPPTIQPPIQPPIRPPIQPPIQPPILPPIVGPVILPSPEQPPPAVGAPQSGAETGQPPLSEEEVAQLEEMIKESEGDIEL
jgi:subtilisin family serine protease